MTERRVHIVGAGLAGLSAALQLSLLGERVSLYEAAPYAGGRCRSYFDRALDCRVDNGNHLVLSGNVAVQDYLYLSKAEQTITQLDAPFFPFMDLASGERWTLQMNKGRLPLWLFNKNKRVPGTKIWDYLAALKVMTAGDDATVLSCFSEASVLYKRLWEPLAIASLNTETEHASAALLATIFDQTLLAGGRACCPIIPKTGLSETFVQPCLNVIEQNHGEIHYGQRLRGIAVQDETVEALDMGDSFVQLSPNDWLILAVPAWVACELLPGLSAPNAFRSIANLHYRIEVPTNPAGFTGLVGGLAEWVFVRPGLVSVTVSAADRYAEQDQDLWAKRIWEDLSVLFDLDPVKVPPWRIVREKRATFAATPEQNLLRPSAYIGWKNLALAGDWTATGLPSTIEGALRSGLKAAQVVIRWRS